MDEQERQRVAEIEARLAEEEAAWERIRQIDKELEAEDSIAASDKLEREYSRLKLRTDELRVRNVGGCGDDVAFLLSLVRKLSESPQG